MNTKICTKCSVKKSVSEFGKHKGGKFGVESVCKPCAVERSRQYRLENPGKVSATKKRYNAKNADKNRSYNHARYWSDSEAAKSARRTHYKNNRQESLDSHKVWRGKNKEYLAERNKLNYAKNREKILAEKAADRIANPEKHRAMGSKAAAKRYATIKGKLENVIKGYVHLGLTKGSKRGRRTFKLLGYTVEDLKSHLESLFQPEMTWENYGLRGWHIDHKIPLAAHNYETPDDPDFKRAWALKNLQPLWAKDNLRKKDKLFAPFQPSLALHQPLETSYV